MIISSITNCVAVNIWASITSPTPSNAFDVDGRSGIVVIVGVSGCRIDDEPTIPTPKNTRIRANHLWIGICFLRKITENTGD